MLCIVFKMYITINTQRSNYGEKLTGGGNLLIYFIDGTAHSFTKIFLKTLI